MAIAMTIALATGEGVGCEESVRGEPVVELAVGGHGCVWMVIGKCSKGIGKGELKRPSHQLW